MFTRVGLLFLALICVGCVPATFTQVPEISGKVINQSGQPVSNAVVHVAKIAGIGPLSFDIFCSADGRFFRKLEAVSGIYIFPQDCFGATYSAQAAAAGNNSEPKSFGHAWSQVRFFGLGAPDRVDLGELRLIHPTTAPTQ